MVFVETLPVGLAGGATEYLGGLTINFGTAGPNTIHIGTDALTSSCDNVCGRVGGNSRTAAITDVAPTHAMHVGYAEFWRSIHAEPVADWPDEPETFTVRPFREPPMKFG